MYEYSGCTVFIDIEWNHFCNKDLIDSEMNVLVLRWCEFLFFFFYIIIVCRCRYTLSGRRNKVIVFWYIEIFYRKFFLVIASYRLVFDFPISFQKRNECLTFIREISRKVIINLKITYSHGYRLHWWWYIIFITTKIDRKLL